MKFDEALHVPPSEVGELYEGVVDRVHTTLQRIGVPTEPIQPSLAGSHYQGELPDDLDALSYSEINNLLAANVSWSRYLQSHRTEVENHLTVSSRQLDALKSSLIKKKGKDYVKSDRRYITLDVEIAEMECLLRCLDTVLQSAKDAYKLLSRSVTIKGQDQEMVVRRDNIGRGFISNGGRNRGT